MEDRVAFHQLMTTATLQAIDNWIWVVHVAQRGPSNLLKFDLRDVKRPSQLGEWFMLDQPSHPAPKPTGTIQGIIQGIIQV